MLTACSHASMPATLSTDSYRARQEHFTFHFVFPSPITTCTGQTVNGTFYVTYQAALPPGMANNDVQIIDIQTKFVSDDGLWHSQTNAILAVALPKNDKVFSDTGVAHTVLFKGQQPIERDRFMIHVSETPAGTIIVNKITETCDS